MGELEAERYEKRLEKEILSKTSFMNTSKWKYLFSLLKNDFPTLTGLKVKFLLDKKIRLFSIPLEKDFVNEIYLEQSYGVFTLKEIEWIYIPIKIEHQRFNREEKLASKVKLQNLKELDLKLNKGKHIEFQSSEEGIKIFGYR